MGTTFLVSLIIIIVISYLLGNSKKSSDDKKFPQRPLPDNLKKQYYVPNDEVKESINLPQGIESVNLNSIVLLNYVDGKNQPSERRVTLKSVTNDYNNDYYINAYCHEKAGARTFKLSRIKRIVDMETGEIFESPKDYFIERFNNSPLAKITRTFQKTETELLILSYLSRSDGFMRKKEREIISDYIRKHSEEELDLLLLDDEIRRTYCDTKIFRQKINSYKEKTETQKKELLEVCEKIVATEKKIDIVEAGILETIKLSL